MFILLDLYGKLFLTLWYLFWSTHSTHGGRRWDLGKAKSSIITIIIKIIIIIIKIKLFSTYFSWYIAYYENVFFTVITFKCLVTRLHCGTTPSVDSIFTYMCHTCRKNVSKYLIKYLVVHNIALVCVCGIAWYHTAAWTEKCVTKM